MIQMLLDHVPVLSVLLPAFTAVLLLITGDPHQSTHSARRILIQRSLAVLSTTLGLLMSIALVIHAQAGVVTVYPLGSWPAPFGIVLVLDRLSALMLLLTHIVALPAVAYACLGWDRRGRYFHALLQFQLMGLCGAFVTGDLFNLFVFFEILLIASYVLLLHGQGRERFRRGLHYVVLNLAASALFLVALALIYALTGTLNMADLTSKVSQLQGQDALLAQSAAFMLLVVFGLKAALVPLYFWLPSTYAAASAPVAALFAIMTKVGVYSIIRVHAVIFDVPTNAVMSVHDWLLPLALASSLLGVLGALAARTLKRLVSYLTVSSVGTILAGVGLFNVSGLSAALYYTIHSTIVVAGLFLLVELIGQQRGDAEDDLRPTVQVREPLMLGLLMLLGAASVAGLPPLPGFIGKLMILYSAIGNEMQIWVWSVILLVGFLSLIGLARAGVILFWHVEPAPKDCDKVPRASPILLVATLALLGTSVVMAVIAAPMKRYTDATALQLLNKQAYIQAVLTDTHTTQPYTGQRPATAIAEAH